jgi:hypothetical protein
MTQRLISRLSRLAAAGTLLAASFAAYPVSAAAPTIGSVTPAAVNANSSTMFSASVNSADGIQYCDLYIDNDDIGAMTVSGGSASLPYTFTTFGVHTMFVFCKNNANVGAAGPNTSIFVTGGIVQNAGPLSGQTPAPAPQPAQPAEPAPTLPGAPVAGSLIKLFCKEGAGADDVCKAVYYVGKDGKRHAFSNSKVFFTWFADFNAVINVTQETMSSFTLGKNVTYRPGSRMIKFPTLNNVYAVGKGGSLSWVTTETVAISLYGTDWNTKIDDVPDAFYGDYKFGADISDATTFSVTGGAAGGATIDDSF